jgi:hypothetical protein
MRKIATVIVAGCLFLGTFVVAEVISLSSKPQTPQEVQAEVEKQAAEIRKTLPKDEGGYVTWFDCEAEWHTIVYKYKIHAPRSLVVSKKKDIEAQLKGSMLLGAAKWMMPKDVKTRFELYDDSGSYIYTLDTDS